MATKEVNKPQSLPPYPELILKALDELNEPNGSNKSAISNHIESIYGELPEGHAVVLAYHLNQMKDNGELVFAKNNYSRPDPSAPPKRGRGRPPKAKDPLAPPPSAVVSPPRPRGRPPKDPNAPPKTPKTSGSGRPRGRPKKIARTEEASVETSSPVSVAAVNVDVVVPCVAAVPTSSGRPRGRPPKVKPQMTQVSVS
ncbi:HMG-Y-related protein A-like [Vicia villosa]|uniref:HMG-Y-related protein A-like n=1 Tax=Vicia villosa TaxID=3911 RepID=UPI00273C6055|nr:HMG-Y-related protein A-like [Vicia villosa]